MNLVNPGVPDGSITTVKLADGAVTAAKVASLTFLTISGWGEALAKTAPFSIGGFSHSGSGTIVCAYVVVIVRNNSGNAISVTPQSQTVYNGNGRSEDGNPVSQSTISHYTMGSQVFTFPLDAFITPKINFTPSGFGVGDEYDAFVTFYTVRTSAY